MRLASRPPDDDHPYGHRKFETMASVGILLFLLLALVQMLGHGGRPPARRRRAGRLAGQLRRDGRYARRQLGVAAYERREGRRLTSEVLMADAHHTTSDILTSCTVIVALLGVWAGYPAADGWAALVVAVFIGHACWGVFERHLTHRSATAS